jgi:hypothetical protein
MLTEGHDNESGLDRNFVNSFADEGCDKKNLERNLKMTTGQAS